MAKLKTWAQTARVQTAAVTVFALWAGYISAGGSSIKYFGVLGLVGLCTHIWGFTMNEVYDAQYDAIFGDAEGHPIAQGLIDVEDAKSVALISGILPVIFLTGFTLAIVPVLLYCLSLLFGESYNRLSKDSPYAGLFLSVWALLLVLIGASTGATPTLATALLGLVFFIQILVQVMEGDLKDISGPENTLIERIGAKYDAETDKVKFENSFVVILYGMKSVELFAILWVVQMDTVSGWEYDIVLWSTMLLVTVSFLKTLGSAFFSGGDRDDIKKRASYHELTSIAAIGVALLSINVLAGLVAIAFPIVWYVSANKILYNDALNPDI